jgi:hypothetical protein
MPPTVKYSRNPSYAFVTVSGDKSMQPVLQDVHAASSGGIEIIARDELIELPSISLATTSTMFGPGSSASVNSKVPSGWISKITPFTLTIASAEVLPRSNTVSLRTMLSSPIPSKSSERLNVPVLVGIGAAVGVGVTVGDGVAVGIGVGGTGVDVGDGVAVGIAVGIAVGGTGVGVTGVATGVGLATGVTVGVEGTGMYLSRLSTHPVAAIRTIPSAYNAGLNTNNPLR